MKNTLYILSLILLMFSCDREDYLDIQPKGQVIPSKINDYRLLLDQTEVFGNTQGLQVISPGFVNSFSNNELTSDDVMITDNLISFFPDGVASTNTYTWNDNIYTEAEEDGDWQTLYGQIYVSNIIIKDAPNASDGTLEDKLALKAEAQAHRAFAYFSLVNLYAPHYNAATANTDLSIPLRLNTELIGIDFPRATVSDVYDVILDDLTEAVTYLPNTPELIHRPSKAGAYSLLARIYLYMGDFENARDAANNALTLNNTLVDFNTFPDWFFPGIASPGDIPQEDPEIIWHKASSGTYSTTIASDDYLNLLEPNDQRRRLFGPPSLFGLSGTEQIYAMGFARGFKPIGPSTAEMFLTRAECYARLNQVNLAVNDLNTLREKRMDTDTFTPITATDQNEVLALVKKERRLELFMKGHRLFDLKRYNVYDTPKIDLTHTYNGNTFTLPANSKNWALPIAKKYILQNPEIGDNIRD
ncbi:RagB/SusD family nutrient uptake outer membrane protein [Postechiella marina]|uniref:RagB/SusD family nutrient uptake outer membrane protein n=1 Tax=Postechiella marina TaxID=943941 RepID=A0ABP8C6P8_9FLAO